MYSPYNSMSNNPISNVDPLGDNPFLAMAIGAGVSTLVGGIADLANDGKINQGAGYYAGFFAAGAAIGYGADAGWFSGLNFKGLSGSVGSTAAGSNAVSNIAAASVANSLSSSDWQPLYKKDLVTYSRHIGECYICRSNDLGRIFEDIVERTLGNDPLTPISGFHRYRGPKFETGGRNTVPDFRADAVYTPIRMHGPIPSVGRPEIIENATWYEAKAKYGNLYSSSNQGQIVGHINNLANTFRDEINQHRGFRPRLYVLTTADVNLSPAIHTVNPSVSVVQGKAHFRIKNGRYQFAFQHLASNLLLKEFLNQMEGITLISKDEAFSILDKENLAIGFDDYQLETNHAFVFNLKDGRVLLIPNDVSKTCLLLENNNYLIDFIKADRFPLPNHEIWFYSDYEKEMLSIEKSIPIFIDKLTKELNINGTSPSDKNNVAFLEYLFNKIRQKKYDRYKGVERVTRDQYWMFAFIYADYIRTQLNGVWLLDKKYGTWNPIYEPLVYIPEQNKLIDPISFATRLFEDRGLKWKEFEKSYMIKFEHLTNEVSENKAKHLGITD